MRGLIEQFANLPIFLEYFLTKKYLFFFVGCFSKFFCLLLFMLLFFFFFCSSSQFLFSYVNILRSTFIIIFRNIFLNITGLEGISFFVFFFTFFMTIILNNLLGLFPFGFTFTSQVIVTLCFSLSFFFGTYLQVFFWVGDFFFQLFLPNVSPIMQPFIFFIELLSTLIRPLSLGVRLFSNILAGHALMFILLYFCFFLLKLFYFKLFQIFVFMPLIVVILIFLLEVLISFLQAYVFFVLCVIYLRDLVNFFFFSPFFLSVISFRMDVSFFFFILNEDEQK